MSEILSRLRRPVVAAPMAGGPSTPALAAAVSGVGGLGFLAAGYVAPDRLADDIARTADLTGQPFGVNVFVPGAAPVDAAAVAAYRHRLAAEARRCGVTLGSPVDDDDAYGEKLRLLTATRVAVVSFTFGLPSAAAVDALHERGTEVWVTATNPAAAAAAAELGADAVVVQGTEAGAHRGGADDEDDYGVLPLLRLAAARTGAPLVAAGGLADGAGVAAVLVAGAAAAQVGTAFLRCPEAGSSTAHRAALATDAATTLTRAYTGRRARAIVNRFVEEHGAAAPRAYPQVHHVTSPLRAAARRAGDTDVLSLWAGQAHALAAELPAAELVERLARDADAALAAASRRLPRWRREPSP